MPLIVMPPERVPVLDRFPEPVEREALVVDMCEHCSEPIYDGEHVYEIGTGAWVHEDCWDQFAADELGRVRIIAEGGW